MARDPGVNSLVATTPTVTPRMSIRYCVTQTWHRLRNIAFELQLVNEKHIKSRLLEAFVEVEAQLDRAGSDVVSTGKNFKRIRLNLPFLNRPERFIQNARFTLNGTAIVMNFGGSRHHAVPANIYLNVVGLCGDDRFLAVVLVTRDVVHRAQVLKRRRKF